MGRRPAAIAQVAPLPGRPRCPQQRRPPRGRRSWTRFMGRTAPINDPGQRWLNLRQHQGGTRPRADVGPTNPTQQHNKELHFPTSRTISRSIYPSQPAKFQMDHRNGGGGGREKTARYHRNREISAETNGTTETERIPIRDHKKTANEEARPAPPYRPGNIRPPPCAERAGRCPARGTGPKLGYVTATQNISIPITSAVPELDGPRLRIQRRHPRPKRAAMKQHAHVGRPQPTPQATACIPGSPQSVHIQLIAMHRRGPVRLKMHVTLPFHVPTTRTLAIPTRAFGSHWASIYFARSHRSTSLLQEMISIPAEETPVPASQQKSSNSD